MRESKYSLYRTSQRAAGGGIAVCTIEGNGLLRASRNRQGPLMQERPDLQKVGETE